MGTVILTLPAFPQAANQQQLQEVPLCGSIRSEPQAHQNVSAWCAGQMIFLHVTHHPSDRRSFELKVIERMSALPGHLETFWHHVQINIMLAFFFHYSGTGLGQLDTWKLVNLSLGFTVFLSLKPTLWFTQSNTCHYWQLYFRIWRLKINLTTIIMLVILLQLGLMCVHPCLWSFGLLLLKGRHTIFNMRVLSGLPVCYLSRGYLHPLLNVYGGIFTPLHQLRGYNSVLKAASPSQAMGEDSKSYFECSIWILTVKCNAHSFSQ